MTHSSRFPADDDLTPEESARLISDQARLASASLEASGAPLYFTWGGVWLVAYLIMGLSYSSSWPVGWPRWMGGVTMALLLIAGMAFTAIYLSRHSRGVRGRSARIGTWYWWSWFLGFVFMGVLGRSLAAAGAPQDALTLYYTAVPAVLVGLSYVSGGLLFESRDEAIIGIVLLAVGILAAGAGPQWATLIMSLAGGGTLIAGGLAVTLLRRRGER